MAAGPKAGVSAAIAAGLVGALLAGLIGPVWTLQAALVQRDLSTFRESGRTAEAHVVSKSRPGSSTHGRRELQLAIARGLDEATGAPLLLTAHEHMPAPVWESLVDGQLLGVVVLRDPDGDRVVLQAALDPTHQPLSWSPAFGAGLITLGLALVGAGLLWLRRSRRAPTPREWMEFEVERALGPLMLYGEGMALEVRCGGTALTVMFPCSVAKYAMSSDPARPPEDDGPLRALFPRGRRIRARLTLRSSTPDAATPELVASPTPKGLSPSKTDALHAAYGVQLVGVVLRVDAEDSELVWVDAGLPIGVLAPWTHASQPTPGSRARWSGDLWLESQ